MWPHSSERENVPAYKHVPAHYHWGKRSGEQTHYGDAALLLLASVVERGRFDAVDFGRRFVETFGAPGYRGHRDRATRGTLERHAAFQRDHPGEAFDFQHGADDFEPSTVSRLAAVVIAHRDDPDLLAVVERATRVVQDDPYAMAHAQCFALILRGLLRGARPRDAVAEAAASLPPPPQVGAALREALIRARERSSREPLPDGESFGEVCRVDHSFPVGWPATMAARPPRAGAMCLHAVCATEPELALPSGEEVREAVRHEIAVALARADDDVVQATRAFGTGCRLDQSFPSAVQAMLRHDGDLREAVIGSARAGGDSAGRAAMIGAWLGAALGVDGVPREWRDRLAAGDAIARDVERLVALRGPASA